MDREGVRARAVGAHRRSRSYAARRSFSAETPKIARTCLLPVSRRLDLDRIRGGGSEVAAMSDDTWPMSSAWGRATRNERAADTIERASTIARGTRAPEPARPEPEPGTRIHQYELTRMLSRGGMGTVYLARDLRLGRRVAIKFLQTTQPERTRLILQEARATARCQHDNIVVIHDIRAHEGVPFIVL